MKTLVCRFNTKTHVSLSQWQLYKLFPTIQNLRVLQTIVCDCELRTTLQAIGNLKFIVPSNFAKAMYFHEIEIKPERLISVVPESTIVVPNKVVEQKCKKKVSQKLWRTSQKNQIVITSCMHRNTCRQCKNRGALLKVGTFREAMYY